MHRFDLRRGSAPDPAGGSLRRSTDPQLYLRGLTSKGREGNGRRGEEICWANVKLLPTRLQQSATYEHIRFLLFRFSVFHFLVVGSVRQIKLTYVGFRAHVKIASRIVLYLVTCRIVAMRLNIFIIWLFVAFPYDKLCTLLHRTSFLFIMSCAKVQSISVIWAIMYCQVVRIVCLTS